MLTASLEKVIHTSEPKQRGLACHDHEEYHAIILPTEVVDSGLLFKGKLGHGSVK
jgi:hypothetical protein